MAFTGGFMGAGTANTAMTDESDGVCPAFRGRIDETMKTRRREEIAAFASYCALLADWLKSGKPEVRAHAKNVIERYAP